ncbi:MAG: hypothetical protein K0S39_1970 [Paenibacillus sp.]|jgi:hypothetical protein|nr:hypothetical protein [Paenibacillus sp.]
MERLTFSTRLIRPDTAGSWTYLIVPIAVEDSFGSRSQVKVKGTVNGIAYRSSLMPNGDGTHYMVVNKTIRDAAGVQPGDTVEVVMEPDFEARTVVIPGDLSVRLEQSPEANESFQKLSFSYQKEYVDWIEAAKKAETRANRIEKTISMVLEGKRLKG